MSLEEMIADVVRRTIREELATLRPAAPDVMTVAQAAAHTERAEKTVRGWLLAGLPSVRKGRRVHIRRADLEEWMTRPEATEVQAIVANLRRTG